MALLRSWEKRKLEAIKKVLQFDKTQEIPPTMVLMSTLLICLWLAIIILVYKYVMHLQVKCHNQSCQLHLAILKLKLTSPLIPFQINIELN